MQCVMAGVCELWKRVISHQSFFNKSMGIVLSNGSLALPRQILERILFEAMKCGNQMLLKLGLVCNLWYQMTKTNSFREKVHFRWLNRIGDNCDAVPDLKREYYVMYDLRECFDCRKFIRIATDITAGEYITKEVEYFMSLINDRAYAKCVPALLTPTKNEIAAKYLPGNTGKI